MVKESLSGIWDNQILDNTSRPAARNEGEAGNDWSAGLGEGEIL